MPDMILYRRHVPGCKHVDHGRQYVKCKCPIWCDGRVDGRRVNNSMKTRDWDRAERRMLSKFDPGAITTKRKLLADALELYLEDCKTRHLKASTVRSYETALGHLRRFGEASGLKYVDQITLEVLTAFRGSRKGRDKESPMRPASHRKELEIQKFFCGFCEARSWLSGNPAAKLKPPKESDPPTMPFEQPEIEKIVAACDKIENANRPSAARARKRNLAVVLTMLYAGLRVSDVALLERARVNMKTGKLLVRMMKTSHPLYVKLGADALAALAALPIESKRYFFWSGNGKPSSIIGSLRRSVACVLKLAGVRGHPHRFRDTFAVRLLEEDTPIRTVQLLLGHTSVKTTERYYAPWIASQQRLLDAATDKLDFSPRPLQEEVVKDGLGDPKGRVLTLTA